MVRAVVEIVVKVNADQLAAASGALARIASQAVLGDSESVVVEPVFPGVTKGRRAGLFTLKLPDAISTADIERLMCDLRKDAAVEYATPAAPKRPQ